MVAKITLQKYLQRLDDVISTNNTVDAKELQSEVLAIFESEFDGLKRELTNYGFIALYSDGKTGQTRKVGGDVDYIKDARILRARLQAELDKIDDNVSNSCISEPSEAKPHKLFISHATKDADYIKELVSLFEALGLQEDEIICSSIPPYCIPLDKKVYDWLVNEFQQSDLHMIFALSQYYYDSAACLNEMGAAWAMKHSWTGLLLPGFGFSSIKGCIDTTQISIKLDDADRATLNYRLEELKNNLTHEFRLRDMSHAVWERKRDEFLKKIHEIKEKRTEEESEISDDIEDHQPVVGLQDVGKIPVEPAFLVVYAAAADGVIMRIDVNGAPPYITVQGNKRFMADMSHRESARWEEALDMLIEWGWVKSRGNKSEMYDLTGTGYKMADMLKDGMEINTDNAPLEELKGFDS